jgi:RNA polymerase sigma-70 factor (sigma-E family)
VAEPDRFAEFVTARSTRLLRTAYLLTHDWAHAEDLLQTALAKAWFAWRRIESDPEPYIRKIMVNTYASWWRRRWNGEQPTSELPERTGRDEYAPVVDRQSLWAALRRLPRRQRAVVVLRYFEDLSELDTAEILGTSVGTVKSQAARALARLRVDPALGEAQLTDLATAAHEGGPR